MTKSGTSSLFQNTPKSWKALSDKLQGDLHIDDLHRALYATDASIYRELPLAVAIPFNTNDLKELIAFASNNKLSLIPRTAGTSLAGQCVGSGVVVDVSKHFNKIISIDLNQQIVTVQPGVVRDDLNRFLKSYSLFFSPNTSTSNRCMIGGMVGNNSSGTTSIRYGVTRDKIHSLKVLLSNGQEILVKALSKSEFDLKKKQNNLEGSIYRGLQEMFQSDKVKSEIVERFPIAEIHRRNTGYALDELIKMHPFNKNDPTPFHLGKLLCGSEGTLVIVTEITLKLDPLPPPMSCLIAAHFDTIHKSMMAVKPVMQHELYSCELMDKTILDCTKNNLVYRKSRFFVEGDPKAILMLELRAINKQVLDEKVSQLVETLKNQTESYSFPLLYGPDIEKALDLRKAGLGLLGNMVGDAKAVACIEDTAVSIDDLAEYINEFSELMERHNQKAVYYAHAGAGEIHLRPILNLKTSEGVRLLRIISTEVASLVKKYKGSLSGEHGDGRVRAEFIASMVGDQNYKLMCDIKNLFDPHHIFNAGKIVEAPKMDDSLRYEVGRDEPHVPTFMNFEDSMGLLRAAEKCNGSGDCRKSPEAEGSMCPSYHVTRNESDTTRGRANALREFLTHSEKTNKFNDEALKQVFDLCLGCKACASECPSNLDVASFKSEFLYQYFKSNRIPLRAKLFSYNAQINGLLSSVSFLPNTIYKTKFLSDFLKRILGVHPLRSLPPLSPQSPGILKKAAQKTIGRPVYLFLDEFTKYLEVPIALDAIHLLGALGYEVKLISHYESGRSAISKGLLKRAKKVADDNINLFFPLVSKENPLLGIEPSAIYSFTDEYPRLATNTDKAKKLANHCMLIEDFLYQEWIEGNINTEQFTDKEQKLHFHAHCHQKALGEPNKTLALLNLPKNYSAKEMVTGCCGMAGSFGYEKEHYPLSMAVANLKLLPLVKQVEALDILVANGTSCRHQIWDGAGREALHPITVLNRALKSSLI